MRDRFEFRLQSESRSDRIVSWAVGIAINLLLVGLFLFSTITRSEKKTTAAPKEELGGIGNVSGAASRPATATRADISCVYHAGALERLSSLQPEYCPATLAVNEKEIRKATFYLEADQSITELAIVPNDATAAHDLGERLRRAFRAVRVGEPRLVEVLAK